MTENNLRILEIGGRHIPVTTTRGRAPGKEHSMTMEKYGVDTEKAEELVRRKLAKDTSEGLEKVASGEADKLIDDDKKKDDEDGDGS